MTHSFMTKQVTSESLVYVFFFSMQAAIIHITKQNLTKKKCQGKHAAMEGLKNPYKFCSLGKQHNRINHHAILLHIKQAS